MSATITIPEAIKKIDELSAKVKDFETYVAEAKKAEAEAKKAEGAKCGECGSTSHSTSEHAEAKKADAEKDEDMKEAKKMLKAATEEQDPEKVKEKVQAAYKKMGMKAEGEARKADTLKEEEEKTEKEAMKAELSKSRLQILTAAYKGRVDEKTLTEYTAQWKKQSFKQLDAEIEKIKPFVAKTIIAQKEESQPLGFSTLQFSASTNKDEYSAKIHEMSDADLFGGKK